MRDIWAFLLQTLTASGAAALLLVVKAMFKDKLSPRWQFSIWSVLGLVLLLPAGLWGRYALFNFPLAVEAAKTLLTGEYTLTRVLLPIPLPSGTAPGTLWDWLFFLYVLGVIVLLGRYLLSYIRLRMALHKGAAAGEQNLQKLQATAEKYHLPVCPAVEAEGIGSAFICGVISPVLVLPAGVETDEKVLLHELLHLKHRDVAWGLVICLFRCVHWCNPLLWYCADQAGNDLESLCDQRVLETLEGEERREYGRILLSMANETYARVPGTSSAANGGKNIRRRIEAIARFKRYPAGMRLVSVCVAVLLAAPLLLGTQAKGVYDGESGIDLAMASARTVWCTTPAGALDTYGKALLEQNGVYRAMCAPAGMQAEIAAEMHRLEYRFPKWDTGLPCWPDTNEGYYVYNLESAGEDTYTALVVVKLNYPPDGQPGAEGMMYLAVQSVVVQKEGSRWVVEAQEGFQTVEAKESSMKYGCDALPAYVFSAEAEDFCVELRDQRIYIVDNTVVESNAMSRFFGPTTSFDTVPKPHAEFDTVWWSQRSSCIYTGSDADKAAITQVGISSAPMEEGEERPDLRGAYVGDQSGSSTSGESWGSRNLGQDWDDELFMSGGGTNDEFDEERLRLPDGYAADLYINGRKAAELTLRLQEGRAQ